MKHNKSIRFLLIALVVIVIIITIGLVSGALPSLGKWFSISPLAPPPSPTALRGLQSSPLGTTVPLPETLPSPSMCQEPDVNVPPMFTNNVPPMFTQNAPGMFTRNVPPCSEPAPGRGT